MFSAWKGLNVLENVTGCSEVRCFFNVSAKLCLCVVLNNVTLAETPSLIFPLLLILLPRQRAILSMEPTRSFCQVVAHLITPPLLLCQILYHQDLIGLPPRGRAHIVCLQWILAQGSLPVSLVSLPKKHAQKIWCTVIPAMVQRLRFSINVQHLSHKFRVAKNT